MSLHPKTKALIEQVLQTHSKRFCDMSVEEFRQWSRDLQKMRGEAPPLVETQNSSIPGPNGDIPVRLYTPKGKKLYPALIYFPGSGFVDGQGAMERQDALCQAIAHASSCKVISVAYRSAPEHQYPIGLNDAYAATKWVIENAKEMNVDPSKIAISGYSSGGNFAALVAIRLRDEGIQLAYQILMCSCLDLSCSFPSHKKYREGYCLDAEDIAWFFNHYLPKDMDRKNPKISPLWEKDLKGLPPALIITAEYDPLCDEGKAYVDRLKLAGVDTKYLCCLGQIHMMLSCLEMLSFEKDPVAEIGEVLKAAFYEGKK